MGNIFNPRPSSLVEIEGSGKFSVDASTFTGTRIAECRTDQLFQAVQFLLGDTYYDDAGQPQQAYADEWPGFPNIICKKVDVESKGRMNLDPNYSVQHSTEWEEGFTSPLARLNCTYGPREYTRPEDPPGNGPEEIPLASQSLDYSCEILTVPFKISGQNGEQIVQRHIRLPTITYTVTFPRILKPNWANIRDCLACVNSQVLFGGEPETVLFDGPHADRELKLFGSPAWKLTYKFIYNRFGWNKQLNPDTLVWEDATAVVGGEKPYQLENLGALLFK